MPHTGSIRNLSLHINVIMLTYNPNYNPYNNCIIVWSLKLGATLLWNDAIIKYAQQTRHIGHICQILGMHILEINAKIYTTYEVPGINHAIRTTAHIFDMYHWTHMAATF